MHPILTCLAIELRHSFLRFLNIILCVLLLDLISVSKKIRELVLRCHLFGLILIFTGFSLEAVNRFKKGL